MEPRYLYKYTSLETAKKIILERRLKFSAPGDFNDPFDCNIDRLDFDLSKADEHFQNRHNRLLSELDSKYDLKTVDWRSLYKGVLLRKTQIAKLCCFSLTNSHPLLWSHYADKHFGACLIFNLDAKKRFIDVESKIGIEGPVKYKEFDKVNYCAGRENAYINLFLAKGKDWEYEQEYRVAALHLESEFVDFHPDFLVGVIFGMKTKNQTIVEFKKDLGSDHESLELKVAIKHNESLHILKWPGPTVDIKGITIHVVSQDPSIEGVFQRLFDR